MISPKDLLNRIKTHYPIFHKETVRIHKIRCVNFILSIIPLFLIVFAFNSGTLLCAEYKLNKNATIVEKNRNDESGYSIRGGLTYVSGPKVTKEVSNINRYENFWISKKECGYSEKENKLYVNTTSREKVLCLSFIIGFVCLIPILIFTGIELFEKDFKNSYLGMFLRYKIEPQYINYPYTIPSTFRYLMINIKEFFGYEITYEDIFDIYNSIDFKDILNYNNERIHDILTFGERQRFSDIETKGKYLKDYVDYIDRENKYISRYKERINTFTFNYENYKKFNEEKNKNL
jgi:hypothetical protein